MQTTIGIEGSSEGDAAANAREAGGGAVANADTPDNTAVPKTPRAPASAALAGKSCRECASIDIVGLAPPWDPKDSLGSLQHPVQRPVLPGKLLGTVNGAELINVKTGPAGGRIAGGKLKIGA